LYGPISPHKILSYNSSLPKDIFLIVDREINVSDIVFVVLTALFFGVAILYLRACERLK